MNPMCLILCEFISFWTCANITQKQYPPCLGCLAHNAGGRTKIGWICRSHQSLTQWGNNAREAGCNGFGSFTILFLWEDSGLQGIEIELSASLELPFWTASLELPLFPQVLLWRRDPVLTLFHRVVEKEWPWKRRTNHTFPHTSHTLTCSLMLTPPWRLNNPSYYLFTLISTLAS